MERYRQVTRMQIRGTKTVEMCSNTCCKLGQVMFGCEHANWREVKNRTLEGHKGVAPRVVPNFNLSATRPPFEAQGPIPYCIANEYRRSGTVPTRPH